MYVLASSLISQLVGYPIGFRTNIWTFPKRSNADDVKLLTFIPHINRPTLILAKYAAVATFSFSFNLLFFTLPLFFALLTTTLSFLSALAFLLLNGFLFVVINFLFLVPALFYCYEKFSFLAAIVVAIVVPFLGLILYFS